MGFVTGTSSYMPYQARGKTGPSSRESLLQGLTAGRITPIDVELGRDRAIGFSTFDDPLDNEFTVEKVFFDPLAVFCLRIDKLSLPATTLRLHVRSRINEALSATGRNMMPRSEREEITEQVRGELLRRALPTVNAYEVVWDTSTGRVRLYSTSQAVNEDFVTLFKDNLDTGLQPLNTVGILESHLKQAELETVYQMMSTTFVAVNPAARTGEDDR